MDPEVPRWWRGRLSRAVVLSIAGHAGIALALALLMQFPVITEHRARPGDAILVDLQPSPEPARSGAPGAPGPDARAPQRPPAPRATPKAPPAPKVAAPAAPAKAAPAPRAPEPPRSPETPRVASAPAPAPMPAVPPPAAAPSPPPPPSPPPVPSEEPPAPAPATSAPPAVPEPPKSAEPVPPVAPAPTETASRPSPAPVPSSGGEQPRVASVPREDSGAGGARATPDLRAALRRGGGSGGGGGAGGLGIARGGIEGEPIPLDTDDPKYNDYLDRIRRMIKAKWGYPCIKSPLTRECEYKTTHLVVEFGILKDGKLQFVDVRQSSGLPIYDDYAVNAIKLAEPFPDVPSGMMASMNRQSTGIAILARFNYVVETSLTNLLR